MAGNTIARKINPALWGQDVTRWIIPILVGKLVSLIHHFGWIENALNWFGVSADQVTLTGIVTFGVAFIYNAIARVLEARFPKQFKYVLGFTKNAHILK